MQRRYGTTAKTMQGSFGDNFRAACDGAGGGNGLSHGIPRPALTGSLADVPRGCMVTLSSVSGEVHPELGSLLRAARTCRA